MAYPPGTRMRVLYDFAAVEEGEMSVRSGDAVRTIAAEDGGAATDGWTLVELSATGASGFVPTDYLSPLVEEATPAAARAPPGGTYASPSSITPRAASSALGYSSFDAPAHTQTHSHPHAQSYADANAASAYASDPRIMSASAVLDAVASAVSPSAPAPPLALAADYAQLFASHEEWFRAASAKRAETYRSLQAEAMDIVRAVSEAEGRSSALLARLGELDALIAEERGRWAAKVAAEDGAQAVASR